MNEYLYKRINYCSLKQNGCVSYKDIEKPLCIDRIYSNVLNKFITVYSLHESNTAKEEDDVPVYMIKEDLHWKFIDESDKNLFYLKIKSAFDEFLKKCRNEFGKTIILPHKNKLNKDFVSELENLAKLSGFDYISYGGLRSISTENVEDAIYIKDSYFRRFYGEQWESKFEEVCEYFQLMNHFNNEFFNIHMIDTNNTNTLIHTIFNTLEQDNENAILYTPNINNKNILIIDDSIKFGQPITDTIRCLSEIYSPKTVSVLTLFSNYK